MLIIRPDYERWIDLPGAGPCPRPVDVDRSRTGFSNLVSLRVYSFARGAVIDGEAEGDEVFVVLMRGEADIAISQGGRQVGGFSLSLEGGSRAVYLPPRASYRLTAIADSDIAYARVAPLGTELPKPRAFAPIAERLDIIGHATGMDLAFSTLMAGETLGLAADGRSPERFVHLRAADEMRAIIAGESLGDWDTVALDAGEITIIKIETGAADILTISASTGRNAASKGATDEPL